MNRRTTVYDLQSQKGRKKWLQIHVDNVEVATMSPTAAIPAAGQQVEMDGDSFDQFLDRSRAL